MNQKRIGQRTKKHGHLDVNQYGTNVCASAHDLLVLRQRKGCNRFDAWPLGTKYLGEQADSIN